MEVLLGSEDVRPLGQLMDGTCVRQSFSPVAPVLVLVSIRMTKRLNDEPGFLYLDVVEVVSRRVLGTSTAMVDEMESDGWCMFETEAELKVGKRYELMLRTLNCRAGMCPVVYCGRSSADGYLFMGSKMERGAELACRMAYGNVRLG